MTTTVLFGRPLRGRSDWSRIAWTLLRVEMGKAREKVDKGEGWAARTNLLEARALCIQARQFDRHHAPGKGRVVC